MEAHEYGRFNWLAQRAGGERVTESNGAGPAVVTTDPGKPKGTYIQDQIMSILFPIVALWYGPKYLRKGEYVKGTVILVSFAITVYYIVSLNSQ